MKIFTRLRKTAFSCLLAAFFVLLLTLSKRDTDIDSLRFRENNGVRKDQHNLALASDALVTHERVPVPFERREEFPVRQVYKRDLDWATAVGKGQALLCNLETAIDGAPQSTWTDYSALTINGWVVDEEYEPIFDDALDTAFKELKLDTSNNSPIAVDQSEPVTINGDDYKASQGFYKTAFYISGDTGFIVADNNKSPPNAGPGPWVPLRQWSDVVFLQWMNFASDNAKSLKYIFRATISNPDTQGIFDQAVLDQTGQQYVGWEDRVTFGMDTERGQAILGTPNGKGVAWLLINHKDQLGVKTIESVTVWVDDPDVAEARIKRTMYFTVADFEPVTTT